ncbi:MAG: hypothetical protein ABJP79_08205 [Tateyamaria sp.]|uniref:hypothetical protein n=1 Tax=Tateyamaria sp. TaxID=1929288 RepID=UPI00329C6BB8
MSLNNAPWYVKLGLFGMKTRKTAMMFMWISATAGIALTLYFNDFLMLLFLLAAVWYWNSIKWIDANDGW